MADRYKSPSYPWYAKEALSSTTIMLMSLAEEGAYRRLLDIQWEDGSIPDDVETIARLLRTSVREARRIWARVGQQFKPDPGQPGRLVNERLERVREAQANYHAGRVAAGRRGAEAKYKAGTSSSTSSPIAEPQQSSSLLLTQEQTQEQVKTIPEGVEGGFDLFWKAYPKKLSKEDARKAWGQTAKARPPVEQIIAKVQALRGSAQWLKNGGEFIKHPASWLRAHGWEDEVIAPSITTTKPGFAAPDDEQYAVKDTEYPF